MAFSSSPCATHVEQILAEAVEIADPSQRQEYVNHACGGDIALRQEVERLVRNHLEAGSFLEAPPSAVAVDTGAKLDQSPVERPGMQIGPYKLLEQIGEGGMGTVWMAQQSEPVRRLVALKLIKAGMDSRQVIARFEAERQALALMDHPNIARVLDGGTTSAGRPYFVMDLVRGTPITQYCDEHHLTPRQRLELFVPVCQAIQHAHQKGIIHRDIKPTNVLVTRQDGQPVVKVIDFGIAKAMGQQLTDKTLSTAFSQMIGTPLYMSPEQAELCRTDIDTRSDIYSLGVLLYELLTGTTPVSKEQLKRAAFDEIRRIIREEDPPKPSTRISTTESAPSIAAQRHTEPSKLAKLVRGELDWIVMKALEKDRSRRYETPSGFAKDIERYLHDEPVEACPPRTGYRLRKFVKRNKARVLAAVLILAALLAGIAGTTWGMVRAEQARRDAVTAQAAEAKRADGERQAKEEVQKRLAQIEKGTEILASVFRDLDPMAAEKEGVTSRDLLCRHLAEAARQLEGEAVGDPLVVAQLQHLLGISLYELGHQEQAEEILVKASKTRERLLGTDHLDTAATRHHLAILYSSQGKYAMAESMLKNVLAIRAAKLGADHLDTAATKHYLAISYASQGKYDLAEALLKEVLTIRSTRLGADHPDTLTTQYRLARVYRSQGNCDLSERLHKELLAIRTEKLGAEHLDTIATKLSLAGLYHVQGKLDLAEPLYQEVLAVRTAKLGAEHPDTLISRGHLAGLYLWQGKYAQAEAMLKEVMAMQSARLGADHPATLGSQAELARLYYWQGNFPLAESRYKELLAVGTARLGADHPLIIGSQHDLAMVYWARRKLELAIPLLEEALKGRRTRLRPEHPDLVATQADLGVLYCAVGRFADAIPLLEEVHQKGREDPKLAPVVDALLTAYLRTGKTTEATALAKELVQTAREQFADDSPRLAVALAGTGRVLLEAQANADAEPLLRESLTLGEEQAPDAWGTHHVRSLLGGALMGQQKYADAEPLLLQAYEALKERAAQIPPEERGSVTNAVERLVLLYNAWGKPDEAAKWRTELEKAKVKP